MKNKNSKNKLLWHNLVPGLKMGALLAFMISVNGVIAQSTKPVKQTKNTTMDATKRKCDSLIEASNNLFNAAQEKYFDRMDRKYTMGLFFNNQEITQLNKIMASYLAKKAGSSDIEYKYAKINLPIRKDLPLNTFVEMVNILGVPDAEMAPFDMVFSNGHLYMFADKKRAKLFEEFLGDSYAGFLDDDDVPDYSIPEFAKIRKEYDRYLQQIDSLNDIIYKDDTVMCRTIDDIEGLREQTNVKNARYVISH